MISKSQLLIATPSLGLLLLLILLSACSAQQSETKTSVSFMIFGDPLRQATYQSLVDAFHATNSEIKVEIMALPSQEDYYARIITQFAGNQPPDVFILDYRRLAQFYNRGALEPLAPFLEASTRLREHDFYPIALSAFRDSQGTLICIPENLSSQVVYYNRDLFDAAKVPLPSPNWTWADFRQSAMALTLPDRNQDGEPDQYGLGLEPRLIRIASFIWQHGGELVDDPLQPTRLTLDQPLANEAMEFIINLSLLDDVLPNETAEAVQSHEARFLSGNIAMYINSRQIVPSMREVVKFNWNVAPLPRDKQQGSLLHSDGYCLSSKSQVKEAAWHFIEFALGEEGQKLNAELGRTVPSLKQIAESDAFLQPNLPPHAQVWLDSIPHLRLFPRLENWVEIERRAGIELEHSYLGRQPLFFAVSKIQETAQVNFVPLK